jgi:signal transduction protein with GAF and PtsI domain
MSVETELSSLPGKLRPILERGGDARAALESAVEALAAAFGAITATLHRADPSARLLHVVVARGIPPQLAEITRRIPFGKGMAGLCAERRDAVSVCNLQTDDSGKARPGARATQVAGGIVVPVLAGDGSLLGTLGIGKREAHDYGPQEVEVLGRCASALSATLARVGVSGI